MRAIICGGRDFKDREVMFAFLDDVHKCTPISLVISGGASGADFFGEQWAQINRIPVEVLQADWRQHGKAAGPIRNRAMLIDGKPGLVIAFPGGKGTANMIGQARDFKIPVIEVSFLQVDELLRMNRRLGK